MCLWQGLSWKEGWDMSQQPHATMQVWCWMCKDNVQVCPSLLVDYFTEVMISKSSGKGAKIDIIFLYNIIYLGIYLGI